MRASVMTRVALMAALTAVGAQLTIPVSPVPFTLQVPMVVLSGILLGPRYGALAQVVYLVMGAVGIPVFAGFSGDRRPLRSDGRLPALIPARRRGRRTRGRYGG